MHSSSRITSKRTFLWFVILHPLSFKVFRTDSFCILAGYASPHKCHTAWKPIKKYDILDEGSFKTIHITLKYGEDKNDKIISGIKRISKPGLRVYAGKEELPRVLGGLGIAIISTNQGVITDKKARELQVGGEVLAYIW